MWKCLTSLLVLALVEPAGLYAQWPSLPVAQDHQLALTVTVEKRLPHRVIAHLTNRSQHDILLPSPTMNCGDAVQGSVLIGTMVLKPVFDGSGVGCVHDYFRPAAPVEQRIAGWLRLPPGRSLTFSRNIPSLPRLPAGKLSIAYNAQYEPPYLSPADLDLLARARIAVPVTKLNTVWQRGSLKPGS